MNIVVNGVKLIRTLIQIFHLSLQKMRGIFIIHIVKNINEKPTGMNNIEYVKKNKPPINDPILI